ncbi:MAG TPA: sialidase family protein, partial [Candidatus Binataceae bacterium]|nr:sialidase family protein [Candidatus Binataceae bacterium]
FSASSDGGATWSTPVRVNNNAEGGQSAPSDQFTPAIGSDKSGAIAICFYDRRRDPANFLIDRECAKSLNGGASWSNARITPSSFPSLVGQDALVAADYMGEYDSVASDSLEHSAGFIDSYASNANGHPAVMTNKY